MHDNYPKERLSIEKVIQQQNTMQDLLSNILCSQLSFMGIFETNKFSLDDAIKYTGIIHRYKKWLQESLKIAAEEKYITYDGNFYSVTGKRPPQMAEIMEHWLQKRTEWEKEEGIRAQAILVGRNHKEPS